MIFDMTKRANVSPVVPTTPTESDVNFYDYDGTLVHSYSASDFASLSELPANPSHAGLTACGWNWDITDAKAYVASYGKLNIGQSYNTNDGKTRIYVHINKYCTNPYMRFNLVGGCDIDWGDNSAIESLSANGYSSKTVSHTYQPGDYIIKLTVYAVNGVSGNVTITGSGSGSNLISGANTTSYADYAPFNQCIKRVEIGSGITLSNYAFYRCFNLETCTISNHSAIASNNSYVFAQCYNLKFLVLPSGYVSIGMSFANNCYNIMNIIFPKTVTTIGSSAMSNCRTMKSQTLPPSLSQIPGSLFNTAANLQTVVIPSGVTSIESYAFSNVSNCNNIVIPNGTTSLKSSSFSGMLTLFSITIPSQVTSIGASAFGNDFSLREIHFLPTTPPTVDNSNAWSGLSTDCIIYVPTGCLSAYTTATNYPSSSTYTYMEE